jgi:hypothetical protein
MITAEMPSSGQSAGAGGAHEPAAFYVSTFNVSATSNEVVVFANEVQPAWDREGHAPAPVSRPRVLLRMSPQSLKDLATILASFVAQYEASYGELQTDYLRRRAGESQ